MTMAGPLLVRPLFIPNSVVFVFLSLFVGVFGVSCDEYLNYAIHNRQEWEMKGEDVVEEYKAKYMSSENEGTDQAS